MDLGLERAGLTCRWQVEISEYCRLVLARHWPNVKRFSDVKDCCGNLLRADASGRCAECGRAYWLPWVDVIAGGFPCQDVSFAGSGLGLDGERSGLWFEFRRLVGELGPRFVVVENVAGLTARGLGQVLGDLADLRFDAEWSSVSACSMGASHVRQRLFIVADSHRQHGRPRVRDSVAQAFRPLQVFDGFTSARVSHKARLENPSALYRDADGVPDRMERNRAIGNAVAPDVAEWIGRRLMQATA